MSTPVRRDARELLSEHGQDRAGAAADLEQPRPGRELGAVADQPLAPVLGLLDEPLLLGRPVAVDVRPVTVASLAGAADLRSGRRSVVRRCAVVARPVRHELGVR